MPADQTLSPYSTIESLLTYPGLNPYVDGMADVFRCGDAGDYAAAKDALLAHYRRRERPLWMHRVATGAPFAYEHPPLTDEEEDSAAGFPSLWRGADSEERARIVNQKRHELGRLVVSYRATGAEASGEFLKEMIAWLHTHIAPPSLEDARHSPLGIPGFFNPLHSCGWVSEPFGFLSQMQLLLGHGHMDADTLIRLLGLVIAICRNLMLHPAGRNAVLVNCQVLVQGGVFLPELSESYWWRRTGLERATGELRAVFYPGGGQVEHTAGYDAFSIKVACNLLKFVEWANGNLSLVDRVGENWERSRLAGLPLPRDFMPRYRQAIRFLAYTALPNFVLLPVGNITSGDKGAVTRERLGDLAECHKRFSDADLLWFATHGDEGSPPAWTSAAYPYMGYFVMRSGWRRDDRYCQLDAGGMGEWHGHNDKLSVLIYGHGRLHVRESSYYGGWFGSEHNVFLVDGQPPQRRHGETTMDQQILVEPYACSRWQTTAAFDYASGRFDEGFAAPEQPGEPSPEPQRLAVWRRAVFFAKPDVFFVTDFVSTRDGRPRGGTALFHLSGERVEQCGNSLRTINSRGSFTSGVPVEEPPSTVAMYVVGAAPSDIGVAACDDDLPSALGVESVGAQPRFAPYPLVAVRTPRAAHSALGSVFVPLPAGGASPLDSVQAVPVTADGAAALGMELRFTDGTRWTFAQRDPDGDQAVVIDGVTYEADAVLLQRDVDGETSAVHQASGQPLRGIDVDATADEVDAWLGDYRA